MALTLSKNERVGLRLSKEAPDLVSLNKSVGENLKKLKLDDLVARVVVVWDASGSEGYQYSSGATQQVANRMCVLALNLDDNGELESWAYADGKIKLPNITLENLKTYIADIQKRETLDKLAPKPVVAEAQPAKKKGFWERLFGGGSSTTSSTHPDLTYWGGIIPGLGYGNNEPVVMRAILDDCKDGNETPTLVIFVTDGGIDKGAEIQRILVEASRYPIFWQFIGIGGSSYGVLESFDKMEGRYVDNANFFALDDYKSVSDEELYRRLLAEFPTWLKRVKELGMLKK